MSQVTPRSFRALLRRSGRIAALTSLLVVAGAMLGVVGGVLLWLVLMIRLSGVGRIGDDLIFAFGAAAVGGFVGAVGAPLLGWGLLGDVPLRRALTEPAAGAFVGASVGILLRPTFGMLLGGGALGLFLAIIRLMARAKMAAAGSTSAAA